MIFQQPEWQSYFEIFHQRFWEFTTKFFLIRKSVIKYWAVHVAAFFTSHLDIRNKMADNGGTPVPHEIDFDISKDRFCWTNVFIMWFEGYQLLTGRP